MTIPPLRIAIYARFSSDKQRDASIEDQIDSCRDYAAQKGWKVVGTYSDRAISGASMFRPGIEQLLRDAKMGKFDLVLSEAMDRLSRNLSDISKFGERMEHAHIRIETLTEGEINEMMIGLKGTMNSITLKDIGLKTRRGQKGRVKEGKSAGGNSYGYTVLAGVERGGSIERGARAINPEQAAVVRRIFAEYAAGISPRKIAEGLNIDRIPGPRGGTWGTSTLHGNRDRGTGVLNNELYIGRMVWNRQAFRKDPDSKKRQAQPNPTQALVITEVPHLRIIDQGLWDAVRNRQGALKSKDTDVPIWDRRRPRTLLSGLMQCSECGSGFSKVSKDAFGCSAARNRGSAVCTNRLTIKQSVIEAAVLNSLEHHLMDPEAVQVFCEEYAAERNRLAAAAGAERLRLEAELAQIKRDHAKLVDAIIAGVPADQVKDRMQTLDARRQQLEVQISHAAERPDPVRIHPSMAATYRVRVSALIRGLGDAEQMDEAKEALRDLVEKVILVPSADGSHLEIELQGALAGLLRLAVGVPVGGMPDGKNGKASAIADSQGIDIIEELVLVAGTGFEPVTFRL